MNPEIPPEDWCAQYTSTCSLLHNHRAFPDIRNQQGSNGCMVFSLVGLMNNYFWGTGRNEVVLSEQHLIDVLYDGDPFPTIDEVADYIRRIGVLSFDVYPWRYDDTLSDFVMPRPPVEIFYGTVERVRRPYMLDILFSRPIAACFSATESYDNWVDDGCQGVYDHVGYEESEENHMVVLIGYGYEADKDFYLVRDSAELEYNYGYKKIACSKFIEGWVIPYVRSTRGDFNGYALMEGYRRLPRLP